MRPRAYLFSALGAAVLFGVSMPIAKHLADELSPVLLAGLLYLGSGLGLWLIRIVRDRGFGTTLLRGRDWIWFVGAVVSGGVLAPCLLMYGLSRTSAGNASLLLNLESVFTALLAWIVFQEGTDRRMVLGMILIVGGGAVLTGSQVGAAHSGWLGEAAIAAACFCWASDNNLTRRIAASDAIFLAGTKGLIAGAANLALAFAFGAAFPAARLTAAAMVVGLFGYGMSLVLFVVALRGLGSARTGAYFSTAPFIGAALAILILGEPLSAAFVICALLMGIGVWLHLTEHHDHQHSHEETTHSHAHTHDLHHQHQHDFPWNGAEPHRHAHHHQALVHRHPHFPDMDHAHRH